MKADFTLIVEFEHCDLHQKEIVENFNKFSLDIDNHPQGMDIFVDVKCSQCNKILTVSL